MIGNLKNSENKVKSYFETLFQQRICKQYLQNISSQLISNRNTWIVKMVNTQTPHFLIILFNFAMLFEVIYGYSMCAVEIHKYCGCLAPVYVGDITFVVWNRLLLLGVFTSWKFVNDKSVLCSLLSIPSTPLPICSFSQETIVCFYCEDNEILYGERIPQNLVKTKSRLFWQPSLYL